MIAALLPQLHNRFAETLGWTLLHSLWQLSLLAALAAAALALLRRASANTRYLLASLTLLFMLVLPIATFCYLLPAPKTTARAFPHYPQDGTATETPAAIPMTTTLIPAATPLPPLPPSLRLKHTLQPCLPAAVTLYFLGTSLMLLRLLLGYARLRRILAQAQPLHGTALHALQSLARRMHIRQSIRLLQSAAIEVPTLIGALQPVILLPASALTGLSPDQLSALLAHELAHIRRYDYLFNLAQSAIETLLFYHPAVWWLGTRIRLERELCCDDAVIAATANRLAYARALATMESLRTPSTMALAATGTGGSLLHRITRILGTTPQPRPQRFLTTSAALLLLLLAALVYLGCNRSTPAPATASTTTTTNTLPAMPDSATSHTYDIRYLLGSATSDPASTQKAVQDLIDTIQSTVAPDSWRIHGGTGELHESAGKLTILQTPENLLAVDKFLAELFSNRAIGINVECRALLVSNNFLDDFRIGWGGATIPFIQAPASITANNASIIDNWTLNLLLTATQADKRTITVTAPRVTTPNGYPVHIDLNPPQPDATAPAAPSDADAALTALSFDATLTVSADRRYIVLLQPAFTRSTTQALASGAPATGGDPAQLPLALRAFKEPQLAQNNYDKRLSSLPDSASMVSIPDGGTLLVDGGPVGDSRHLLLLVRPSLIAGWGEGTLPVFAAAGGMSMNKLDPNIPRGNQILVKALVANVDPAIADKVTAELLNGHAPGTALVLADVPQELSQAITPPSIFSRPVLLVNEGESGVITIGQQLNYIADITHTPDGDTLDIKTLSTGLTLKILATAARAPTAAPDTPPAIHLDIDASLSALIRMDQGTAAAPGPDGKGEIHPQVPVLDTLNVKTAATTQNNHAIAILIPPSGAQGGPKTATVLILTPRFVNKSDLSMDEAAGSGR